MGSDIQYNENNKDNEEQFEMLLMTLEEVKHGICLFRSQYQEKWVSLIQERLGKENIIVHNIANDEKEKGMVNSQDFRRWASESDAKVIIVYNMQLLGLRFGDKEVVEKLNFMRDQILAIGKLFVFGVSFYFDLLLSRGARDLYSCILYHFILQDSEEQIVRIQNLDMPELSGDDILETARYKEIKERIQSDNENRNIPMYLECMKSWSIIRQYLLYQEKEFIMMITEEVDKEYTQKDIEITDVKNIWILAKTWIELEKAERSISWYEKVICFVRDKLGEKHELYADALVEYVNYYEVRNDYIMCEKFCDQAIEIYSEKNMKYSEKGRGVLRRKGIVYRIQSKFEEALKIYQDLLNYQINKYGENYYDNACIYNHIGRIYEESGNLSNALLQYEKALELLDNAGKRGYLVAVIYQNIGMVYLKSGDGREAWRYIKNAKKIIEDIYGKNSSYLIDIYYSMSEVWRVWGQPKKELEYLQRAIKLIKETHMEKSEIAAYVYHNIGKVFY